MLKSRKASNSLGSFVILREEIAQTFRKICKGKCYVLVGLACFDTLESVDGRCEFVLDEYWFGNLLYLSVKTGIHISAEGLQTYQCNK